MTPFGQTSMHDCSSCSRPGALSVAKSHTIPNIPSGTLSRTIRSPMQASVSIIGITYIRLAHLSEVSVASTHFAEMTFAGTMSALLVEGVEPVIANTDCGTDKGSAGFARF